MWTSQQGAVKELLVGSTHVVLPELLQVEMLFLTALKPNIFPKHKACSSCTCRNPLTGLAWELPGCHILGYVCKKPVSKIEPSGQKSIPTARL